MSDRSSHDSPVSTGSLPSWGRPRTPLPPHKLARVANALGVSTPVPSHSNTLAPPPISASTPSSAASVSFPDHFRRSPTPSMGSSITFTPAPSTSKYLLQVIPPLHLPHEASGFDDFDLVPPPPNASGYHAQFRRGILVPIYPNFHTQLGAIAKEYALPSIQGMVLYFVASSSAPNKGDGLAADEPGPRISEDIWRHIWSRVVHAEKEDAINPRPMALGYGIANHSSPSLIHDITSSSFKSLLSPRIRMEPTYSLSPSPSTPSGYSSQSEIPTPDSASSVADTDVDALLPGLGTPGLIPILAKVEFDIDRRRAPWYDPWLRSRIMSHTRRAESRAGMRSTDSRMGEEDDMDGTDAVRRPLLGFELVEQVPKSDGVPAFLREQAVIAEEVGYTPLEDEPDAEASASEYEEDEEEDEVTARVNVSTDLLADVFGTDADAWAEIQADPQTQRSSIRRSNPHVVDLALDAAALSALPEPDEDEDGIVATPDEDEVATLWNRLSRPSLQVSIPPSPTQSSQTKRQSSPTTAGTLKKHIPPPLNLLLSLDIGLSAPASPMPPSSTGSAHLPYLAGDVTSEMQSSNNLSAQDPEFLEDDAVFENEKGQITEIGGGDITISEDVRDNKIRSPQEEKRDGGIFEDFSLGLDQSKDDEFDESDPHDRRKSQYIMKAQLDEIEKTLAQFSPRQLHLAEIDEDTPRRSSRSTSLSPRLQRLRQGSASLTPAEGASWPAVPYSALTGDSISPTFTGDHPFSAPSSPPSFAINGISTELPKSPYQRRTASDNVSDESAARRRELEEQGDLYPPLIPPALGRHIHSADSPVIPLSPDPFGRFPSPPTKTIPIRESQTYFDNSSSWNPHNLPDVEPEAPGPRPPSQTPSSRFSFDSVASDDAVKATNQKPATNIMSVKGIRKLWRRTNKPSLSGSATSPPESGRSSPNPINQAPQVGRLRSRSISKSPQPPPADSSDIPPPPTGRRQRSVHQFQFDQESPYPMHPTRPPTAPPTPVPTQSLPLPEQSGKSSVRKSILKSWKSASGNLATNNKTTSSTTTPRTSTELLQDTKRRRPSVLDVAASVLRGSVVSSSSSSTLVDIPPSPALPEHFSVQAQAQGRASLSQSDKSRPSVSSSAGSSPPRARSRLGAASPGSPPLTGELEAAPRMSGESYVSRPSFDASQFEIVSPKLGSYKLDSALSYPYHGLDHSMSSVE